MSCFIMSPEAIATVSNTMESILNCGSRRYIFSAPESLSKALSDCRDCYGDYSAERIYSRLYRLNAAAYFGRYRLPVDDSVPPMPEVPILTQLMQYSDHGEILLPWHFKFAKLLDCLIYQCSEDATRADPLLLALIDFSRVYAFYLVRNHPFYTSSGWGSLK